MQHDVNPIAQSFTKYVNFLYIKVLTNISKFLKGTAVQVLMQAGRRSASLIQFINKLNCYILITAYQTVISFINNVGIYIDIFFWY